MAFVRFLRDILLASLTLLPALARDILGLGGCGAITYGVYLLSRPGAWIIGGLLALMLAWLLARGAE